MNIEFSPHESSLFKNSDEELKILRITIEKAPIAISMSDADGHQFFHNHFFSKLFGYNIEECRLKVLTEFFVDPDKGREIIERARHGESWAGEVDLKKKSGRIVPVMLRFEAIRDEKDAVLFFLGIYENITGRKNNEKSLAHQHEYLATLHSISLGMFRRLNLSSLLNAIIIRASKLAGIPNGFLYLYDAPQNILEMRAACGSMARYIGYKIPPGNGLAGSVFKKGEPMIINNYQTWPGKNSEKSLDDISSIIGIPLVSGSKIVGVIGLNQDRENLSIDSSIITILEEFAAIAKIAIDNAMLFENQKQEFEKRIALEKERKDMEARLSQSQRMESIGTLAGGIAHDFNNILSSIMGFTQMAQGDAEEGSELKDDLDEVYKASLRAKDLVQQILTFARESGTKVNAVKVSIIAKEVLKFIRSSIPSTIAIEQNINSASKVMADPTQVYQIFLNLFTNASQAMEEQGGTLKVEFEDTVLDKAEGVLLPGRYIKIMISDTGTGIAKNHIQKIFEPYFTTKEVGEGTGLGLAVVHGSVKSMGGEISVESEPGHGTRFMLHLPVVREPARKYGQENPDDEKLPLGKLEHLLFVDDEAAIAKLGKRLLEILNYRVTSRTSSLEALELFQSKPDAFRAVLTDMTMPDMTGDKLAVELKKIRPDIPIILCTGYDKYFSDKNLEEKGVDYFCKKPFSKAELAEAVRIAIHGDDKIKK